MDHIVDIADFHVAEANGQPRTLVTYSLGSCIGVVIYDPVMKVGGMLHYMLPDSTIALDKAKNTPSMFADTGLPLLFKSAYKLGAEKKRLVVKVAGGSQLLDDNGTFNIGRRNYLILRKIFWKNGIMIDSEHVGGALSRTMRLDLQSGVVTLKTKDEEVQL